LSQAPWRARTHAPELAAKALRTTLPARHPQRNNILRGAGESSRFELSCELGDNIEAPRLCGARQSVYESSLDRVWGVARGWVGAIRSRNVALPRVGLRRTFLGMFATIADPWSGRSGGVRLAVGLVDSATVTRGAVGVRGGALFGNSRSFGGRLMCRSFPWIAVVSRVVR